MSNYTKTVNFAIKDSLSSGDPNKIVSGTDLDNEFNNIATAVATKADSSAVPALASTSNVFNNSQNATTLLRVTNPNAGASAQSRLEAANGSTSMIVAVNGQSATTTPLTGGPTGTMAFVGTDSTVSLSFSTNNTERVRIAGDGSLINLASTSITLTGNATITGQTLITGSIAPTALSSGNTNDYAPTGLSGATVLRLTANAGGSTLTGITGGADGRLLIIQSVAGGGTLSIAHESASSSAANRFSNISGSLLSFSGEAYTQTVAMYIYNSSAQRWVQLNG